MGSVDECNADDEARLGDGGGRAQRNSWGCVVPRCGSRRGVLEARRDLAPQRGWQSDQGGTENFFFFCFFFSLYLWVLLLFGVFFRWRLDISSAFQSCHPCRAFVVDGLIGVLAALKAE